VPLLACLAGCGSYKVSGKVTYKGQPLHTGIVVFTTADGWTGTSQIKADGSYSIANVPPGTAKIGVESFGEQAKAPRNPKIKIQRRPKDEHTPPPAAADNAPVQLPVKFKKPETSGLTCEVTGRTQIHDIQIN
jgi:hypothetical protein